MIALKELYDLSTMGDPRMDDFLLMKEPLHPICIGAFYLIFIYKLGPKLMSTRPPFDLRIILIIYNLIQIISNFILFLMLVKLVPSLSIVCTPVEKSGSSKSYLILRLHHYYLLLKFLDLLDTIFYVLRKNYRQITYLHVHHHVGMLAAIWISGKYFPGGQGIFVGLYNTCVHVVMYTYYLLSIWNPKQIWWKKHVTLLQIIQHYLILISCFFSVVNVNCSYPKGWMGLFLCNVTLMIYLFSKFYQKTYRS